MKLIASKDAYNEVDEMRRGLHIAMDHLINRNDAKEAERVLRQIDVLVSRWLNGTKIDKNL